MPIQILFAVGVELCMIVVTTLLLAQPKWLFPGTSEKGRSFMKWAGMMSMGLTFIWSVILGCLLALSELTWQL